MSNLSVKEKAALIQSGFSKGFNTLNNNAGSPMTSANNDRWNNNNNKGNNFNNVLSANGEIPNNLFVSPSRTPNGVNNNARSVASSFAAPSAAAVVAEPALALAPAAPSIAAAPVSASANKAPNAYANMIAKWKARNTSKNKIYKTRANYNANNQAKLRSQLAQTMSSGPHYNNGGEEHSTQYWENKRAANKAKGKVVAQPHSKWATVQTAHGGLRKSRRNRRKTRKNRRNGCK
jgi:hypothetical protein